MIIVAWNRLIQSGVELLEWLQPFHTPIMTEWSYAVIKLMYVHHIQSIKVLMCRSYQLTWTMHIKLDKLCACATPSYHTCNNPIKPDKLSETALNDFLALKRQCLPYHHQATSSFCQVLQLSSVQGLHSANKINNVIKACKNWSYQRLEISTHNVIIWKCF